MESTFVGVVRFLVLMLNDLNLKVKFVFLASWIGCLFLFEKNKVNCLVFAAFSMQNVLLPRSLLQIWHFYFFEWLGQSVIFFHCSDCNSLGDVNFLRINYIANCSFQFAFNIDYILFLIESIFSLIDVKTVDASVIHLN